MQLNVTGVINPLNQGGFTALAVCISSVCPTLEAVEKIARLHLGGSSLVVCHNGFEETNGVFQTCILL